jgi:hypothetical protein
MLHEWVGPDPETPRSTPVVVVVPRLEEMLLDSQLVCIASICLFIALMWKFEQNLQYRLAGQPVTVWAVIQCKHTASAAGQYNLHPMESNEILGLQFTCNIQTYIVEENIIANKVM